MPLRNRAGDPVDPVPFLVVASAAFLVVFSSGPIYLRAVFGLPVATGLVVSAVVFLVIAAAAYHRYVYATRPDLRGEVPAATRFRRLLYGALVLGAVFLVLTLSQVV
ncbi:hypothetical protein [Halorarum halobium]|uniref:hypothetical protein n=1 Tax=Halorarum halobium TaxID=3075121 RepID=UPI0028B1A928|nr:hypothetical protein [Halobaculum sp. XH14]